MPEVPTFGESGYKGFEPEAWMGLLMPAGAPPERAAALSKEVARIVRLPEIDQRMRELNLVPIGNTLRSSTPCCAATWTSGRASCANWTSRSNEHRRPSLRTRPGNTRREGLQMTDRPTADCCAPTSATGANSN